MKNKRDRIQMVADIFQTMIKYHNYSKFRILAIAGINPQRGSLWLKALNHAQFITPTKKPRLTTKGYEWLKKYNECLNELPQELFK